MRIRTAAGLFLSCFLSILPRAAHADAPTPAPPAPAAAWHWDPAWTHADAWDYTLTGVGAAVFGVELFYPKDTQTPIRWNGAILFDDDVRSVLRGQTQETRDHAATVSWVLLGAQLTYPLVVDVPYARIKYGRRVAWDLFWQDTTVLTLAGAIDFSMRDLIGRARPGITDCIAQGGTDCAQRPEAAYSFPGGHFLVTTAAASLVCTQHLAMELYGAPWDAVTCGAAIATDAGVGVLRIVTDNHWATDIVAGGALGFLIGWGVPQVMHLHLHAGSRRAEAPAAWTVLPVPMTFAGGGGVGVVAAY